jgi:hypothetical protein
MWKFIAILTLAAGSFAGGYYLGQQPDGTVRSTVSNLSKRVARSEEIVGDVRQSLKNLSQNALDTTLSIERDLRRRQGLVEAKSRLVQAKSYILDHNFSDAAKELAEAVTALEVSVKDSKQDPTADALVDLAGLLREMRLEVAMGKPVPLKKLNDVQQKMDQLLDK